MHYMFIYGFISFRAWSFYELGFLIYKQIIHSRGIVSIHKS